VTPSRWPRAARARARGGKGRPPRTRLLALALALLLGCAGSVALGSRISNPRELAAHASAPHLGLLTTTVRRQVVRQVASFDASPTGGQLSVPAVGGSASTLLVVTALSVQRGDRVGRGHVLAVLSGRPIIGLPGRLPAYRDLGPGMSGPDVRQLREALDEIDLPTPSDRRDWFGPATQAAVGALYARLGFDPVLTSPDALTNLERARQSVRTARRALTRASRTGPAARITAAKASLDAATSSLETLEASSGVTLPRAEVFYVPARRAEVSSVDVKVGQEVETGTPLLSLTSGRVTLLGTVDPGLASQLRPGLHGKMRDPGTGQTYPITTVARPADVPVVTPVAQADGGSAKATDPEQPDTAAGSEAGNVALSVPAEVSSASVPSQVEVDVILRATPKPVLAVPSTALSTTVDGQTWVDVVATGQRVARVSVAVGLSGGGLVQVSSTDPRLRAGAQVVVGQEGTR
jgi:hypothetical protein